jgi:hypothetical protein
MIIDFLHTTSSPADLQAALAIVREFKAHESPDEWLYCPFLAWAKLEQLEEFLAYLVEGKAII